MMTAENRPSLEMQNSNEKTDAAALARENFQRVIAKYSNLHDDLLALRSYDPQRRLVSRTTDEWVSQPDYLSPDERLYVKGGMAKKDVTRDYLITRGRKIRTRGWSSTKASDRELMQIQGIGVVSAALEKDLSQELTYELERAKKAHLAVLADDEMRQQYQKQWQESLDELTANDQQHVADSERTWSVHEEAYNSLLSLLPQIGDLADKFYQLDLKNLSPPISSKLAPEYLSDSSEKGTQALLQKISEAKDYLAKAESMIAAELEKRQLQEIADELKAKTAAEMAEQIRQSDIERYGVTGRSLEIARALADVAAKKMGEQKAIIFFDDVYNKPYGRQRRMNDVEAQFGKSLSGEADGILHFGRAEDFNSAIFATKQVLLESQSLAKKTKQNDKVQMNEDEPMETEMARKLKAAMASLG